MENKLENYVQCYFPSFRRSYVLTILGRGPEYRGYHVLAHNPAVQEFEPSSPDHHTPSDLEVECQSHGRHNK